MNAKVAVASTRVLDVLAFFLPLTAYVLAISPWPAAWDYGEYETVPYLLGISHATGFPAFVLLGWLFSHVVVIGTVALRLKLMSACFVVGAALLIRPHRHQGVVQVRRYPVFAVKMLSIKFAVRR